MSAALKVETGATLAPFSAPWPRLPAEHLGRARQFRDRLVASAVPCMQAIDRITAKTVARHKRRPIPRPDDLLDLARAWGCELPAHGRLELAVQLAKRSLTIRELRCDGSKFRADGWTEHEPGICVILVELQIGPQKYAYRQVQLVAASLHCLARRFERGGSVSDETVLAELHHLAREYESGADRPVGSPFEAAMADGGKYLGNVIALRDKKGVVLSLRTYVGDRP